MVRIEHLVFVACARSGIYLGVHYPTYYGLHFQSVQTAEIIDCTFQDSYGSALGVVDSHVFLRQNNSFLNNCRLCSNGTCHGYTSHVPGCYGGGVLVQRSDLTITGSSRFSGNSAIEGGGVYAWYSNVYVSGNTTFSGNSASIDGGGMSARYGSKVYINGNTNFSGNSAGWGGGVSTWDRSIVYISGNTTFSGNSASGDGGGVRAWDRSTVDISGNTTFNDNSANDDGGGVSASDRSNVYII